MNCIPEDDAHTEECIKGTNPCDREPKLTMAHEDDFYSHETESNYAAIGNSKKQFAGTIDVTPVGCQSLKGNDRVNEAMLGFQQATAQVANAAETMYYEMLAGGEFEDWTELSAAIQARKEKQEAFLAAVAGR